MTYLRGVHARFTDELSRRPAGDAATGLTRERWLLLLLPALGYGPVPTTPGGRPAVDGRALPGQPPVGRRPRPPARLGRPPRHRHRTASPGRPARAAVDGAGAAQPQPTTTCGRCCPTGGRCGCSATPPRWSARPTSSSTWRPSSTASCSRLRRCSTCSATSPALEGRDRRRRRDRRLLAGTLAHRRHRHRHPRARPLPSGGPAKRCETLGTGFLRHPANAALRERLAGGQLALDDVQPGAAAAGLPAAVLVRRRGPARAARPGRRTARP